MSSVKLNNCDFSANDHVRLHIKRQQKWLKSESVKNWRKSSANTPSKQSPVKTKCDNINGNSGESLNTASSSSEFSNIFDLEYEQGKKEVIEKCLKWIENLPTKFSGLHILDPTKSQS